MELPEKREALAQEAERLGLTAATEAKPRGFGRPIAKGTLLCHSWMVRKDHPIALFCRCQTLLAIFPKAPASVSAAMRAAS